MYRGRQKCAVRVLVWTIQSIVFIMTTIFFWVLLCVYLLHADDDDSFCRVDARGCDDGDEGGSTERGWMEVEVCVWVSGCVYERTTIFVSAMCR